MSAHPPRQQSPLGRLSLALRAAALLGVLSCRTDTAVAPTPEVTDETLAAANPQALAALEALTAEIVAAPEDASLYYRRGRIFADNEVLDRAIDDFQRSIRYDSNQVVVWHALADAQLDNLRSREALNTMIYASSRFADQMGTLLKLAEFQLILRRYEDAEATLERAGRLDPTEGEVFFMLGQIIQERDSTQTAEAIQAYERAVELNPKIVDGWLEIGGLYERRGKPIAERYFKTATEIDRNAALPWRMLADYYSGQDRLPESIAAYDRAIALDPHYAEALYNSGLVLLDLDSVDRALRQFDLATQVAPTYADAHYHRGVALELQRKPADALRAYRQALALSPDFTLAQDAIDRLSKAAK